MVELPVVYSTLVSPLQITKLITLRVFVKHGYLTSAITDRTLSLSSIAYIVFYRHAARAVTDWAVFKVAWEV